MRFSRGLESRPWALRVIANTGWLFADRIIRMGAGLAVGVWVARYLGPDQFGLLSYAIAFVALWSAIAALGLDGVVVRELVRDPGRKNEILGSAFLAKLVGGGLALLLAVAGVFLLRPGDQIAHGLVAVIAAGSLFQSFDVIDFWFQSRVESRFGVYAKTSTFLVVSAIRLALIANGAPLFAFGLATGLEVLLGAIGLVFVYRVKGQRPWKWTLKLDGARKLVKDSWPLALASMAIMVYMKIDLIMIGQMFGNHEAGLYGAAIRFSEVWYFIPVSIVASLSPSIVEAKKAGADAYYKRLANLFKLLMGVSLAIAIPMTLASGYLSRAVYGDGYEGVALILAIHIWSLPFVFLGVAQSPWTLNEGMTKLALFRTSFGAIANVVLNLWLIPKLGAVGAAISTTASYAMSAVILNAFSAKTRRIFFLQLNSINLIPVKR